MKKILIILFLFSALGSLAQINPKWDTLRLNYNETPHFSSIMAFYAEDTNSVYISIQSLGDPTIFHFMGNSKEVLTYPNFPGHFNSNNLFAIIKDSFRNLYTAGYCFNPNGWTNAYGFFKLDSSNNLIDASTMDFDMITYKMAIDSSNRIVIGGSFNGSNSPYHKIFVREGGVWFYSTTNLLYSGYTLENIFVDSLNSYILSFKSKSNNTYKILRYNGQGFTQVFNLTTLYSFTMSKNGVFYGIINSGSGKQLVKWVNNAWNNQCPLGSLNSYRMLADVNENIYFSVFDHNDFNTGLKFYYIYKNNGPNLTVIDSIISNGNEYLNMWLDEGNFNLYYTSFLLNLNFYLYRYDGNVKHTFADISNKEDGHILNISKTNDKKIVALDPSKNKFFIENLNDTVGRKYLDNRFINRTFDRKGNLLLYYYRQLPNGPYENLMCIRYKSDLSVDSLILPSTYRIRNEFVKLKIDPSNNYYFLVDDSTYKLDNSTNSWSVVYSEPGLWPEYLYHGKNGRVFGIIQRSPNTPSSQFFGEYVNGRWDTILSPLKYNFDYKSAIVRDSNLYVIAIEYSSMGFVIDDHILKYDGVTFKKILSNSKIGFSLSGLRFVQDCYDNIYCALGKKDGNQYYFYYLNESDSLIKIFFPLHPNPYRYLGLLNANKDTIGNLYIGSNFSNEYNSENYLLYTTDKTDFNQDLGLNQNKLSDEQLLIFPNPSNNSISFRNYNSIRHPESINVYNNIGQRVISLSAKETIQIETLSHGIYYVIIRTKEGIIYQGKFEKY